MRCAWTRFSRTMRSGKALDETPAASRRACSGSGRSAQVTGRAAAAMYIAAAATKHFNIHSAVVRPLPRQAESKLDESLEVRLPSRVAVDPAEVRTAGALLILDFD